MKTLKTLITEARLKSVTVMNDKMLQAMATAAQQQYDAWAQNEEGYDEELGSGGICHLIAEDLAGILSQAGIEASTVSSTFEQHVYVVAKFREGVYQIDIPYHTYERGGGFTWKKLPDVKFDTSHVSIYPLDRNPRNFHQYIDQMEEGKQLREIEGYDPLTALMGDIKRLEINLKVQYPELADLALFIRSEGQELHLNSLRVKPNYRRKGIGGKVMDAICDFADDHQMYITLKPQPEHGYKEKLHKFYKQFGFYPNKGRYGMSQFGGAFGVYWIRRPMKKTINESMAPKSAVKLNRDFRLNYTNWGAAKTIFPRIEEIMRNPIFLPAYKFAKLKKMKSLKTAVRNLETQPQPQDDWLIQAKNKLSNLIKNEDLFSLMNARDFFFTVKYTIGTTGMANGIYKNPLLVNLLRVKYPDLLEAIKKIKSNELDQMHDFVYDKLKGKIDDEIIHQIVNRYHVRYVEFRDLVKQVNPELADWLDWKVNYHEPMPMMEIESPHHEEVTDKDIKRGYIGTIHHNQLLAYDTMVPNVMAIDHSEFPGGRAGTRWRYFVERPWNTILWNEYPPSKEHKQMVEDWLRRKGVVNPRDISLSGYHYIYNR